MLNILNFLCIFFFIVDNKLSITGNKKKICYCETSTRNQKDFVIELYNFLKRKKNVFQSINMNSFML